MDASEVRAAWERAAGRALDGGSPTAAASPATVGVAAAAPTFAGVRQAARADDLEGAGAVVLGIPFGGADGSPRAIRVASASAVALAGAVSGPPMDAWAGAAAGLAVVDYGDVAAVAGDPEATFTHAHERLADIVAAGAVPLVLGGDHSVTVAVLQVLAGMLTGRLGIVALDTRLDLAFEPRYAAGSQWARALELGMVDPANIVLVGPQEECQDPIETLVAEDLGLRVYSTGDIDALGMATVAQEALEVAAAGTEAIYVSLDLSVADGQGTWAGSPRAGLGSRELATAIRTVAKGRVVGFDVVAPACDAGLAAPVARDAACAAVEIVAGLAAQRPRGGAGRSCEAP